MIEELQIEGLTLEVAKLFPRQGEWTERDYFNLPESNRIIELSEGRLIISPSPTPRHQEISSNLFLIIATYVKSNKSGKVCYSPIDIRLWEGKIRQPDIAFMGNEHLDRITEEFWGIPDLIIEILSEGNIKVDKEDKYFEYQKAGVLEYWIVDTFQQSIEIFNLENGVYALSGKWSAGDVAHSKALAGLQFNIDSIFE